MKFEKLGNIANVIAGQSPPSETYNKSGDGIPFFQGKADYGEKYPIVRNWCTSPKKISIPNDILISIRAPVGPVNINNTNACIGRGLSAIRTNSICNYEYLYYYLKAKEQFIAQLGVGSTFFAITQNDLKKIQIPLPPLSDQIKIATVLSKAEALIQKKKQNISLLDEFLKSTFLKMFGDPVKGDRLANQKGCKKSPLDKYVTFENGDRSSNYPSGDDIVEEGIIFVNSANIVDFRFLPINPSFITKEKFDSLRSGKCKSGDILFTLRGNGLGKCCIFTGYSNGFVNAQLVIIRPSKELNNIF